MPCYLNMSFSKAKRSLIAKLRLGCHSRDIETMRYCIPKVVRHICFSNGYYCYIFIRMLMYEGVSKSSCTNAISF